MLRALAGCARHSTVVLLACALIVACSHHSPTGTASARPLVATSPPPSTETAPAPYVLDHTEVREITSKSLGREYPLFLSLPTSYTADPTHRYPVLFVTDTNYAFPLVRSIARRLADHGHGLEEFLLVGLGYAKGDTPEYSRRRDYTPTPRGDKNPISDMPGRPPVYGQADAYRGFIANEVFPFLAHNYRVDMRRKIYAGGSYGGLLGARILLSAPDMFEAYILISPSLWFDEKVTLKNEGEYAAGHRDLAAKVFLAVGGFETVHPGSPDSRYNRSVDMVRDMLTLQDQLKSRHYPGLTIQSAVLPDENHLTVYPAAMTRGLLWVPLLQHAAESEH